VALAPPLGGGEVDVGLDQVAAEPQQVVEVDHAGLAFRLLVAAVQVGDPPGGRRRAPAGGRHGVGIAVGTGEAGLGPLDLGRELPDRELALATRPADDLVEQAALADQELGRGPPLVGPAPAELRVGDTVERTGGHAVTQSQGPETVPQLTRGLAGERQGQDMAGVGIAGLDAPGDATSENPGLARSRRCEDRQGPGRRRDGTPLRLVQVVEQAIGGHRGRGYSYDRRGHQCPRGPADRVLRRAPPWGNLLPDRSSAAGPQAALTTLSQEDVANGRRP
jgi:hypothetical protein